MKVEGFPLHPPSTGALNVPTHHFQDRSMAATTIFFSVSEWRQSGKNAIGTAFRPLVFISALAFVAAGCGSDNDPVIPTGTCPTGDVIEDITVSVSDGEEGQTLVLNLRPVVVGNAIASGALTFSLLTPAQALSCVPPPDLSPIVWLNIVSDSDFDSDHTAGTYLNDLVYYQISPVESQLLDDRLEQEPITLWHYVDTRFYFVVQPTLDQTHTLTLEIMLDNGSYFEVTTAPIEF